MPDPAWVGPDGRIVLNETPAPDSAGIPVTLVPSVAVAPQSNSPVLAEPKSVPSPANEACASGLPESAPKPPSGFRFTKLMRLRKGAEFQAVFFQKSSVSDKILVLYLKANGLGYHRIGLCISKKVTKNAPNRTLWKRMLREAFRLDHHSWPGGYDFVILSRTMRPPTLEVLRDSFSRLVRRGITRPQQGYRPPKNKDKNLGKSRPPESPQPNGNPSPSAPLPGPG